MMKAKITHRRHAQQGENTWLAWVSGDQNAKEDQGAYFEQGLLYVITSMDMTMWSRGV